MNISKKLIGLVAFGVFLSSSASAYEDKIVFQNFDSFEENVGDGWGGANYTSIPVQTTDKGKSACLVTDSANMKELYIDFSPTDIDTKSVAFGCSLKFAGQSCGRALYSRNGDSEYNLVYMPGDGKIYIGNKAVTNAFLENDVWYNFSVEYNAITGYTRCKVTDEKNVYFAEGYQEKKNLRGLYRYNIVAFLPTSGESKTYVDNAWFKALEGDVVPYSEAGISNCEPDFGYVSSSLREITLNLTEDIDADSIGDASIKINNSADFVSDVTCDGTKLKILLSDFRSENDTCFLEVDNVKTVVGNVAKYFETYYLSKPVLISNFKYMKSEISPGPLTVMASVSSPNGEVDSVTFFSVLYDAENGNIEDIKINTSQIDAKPKTLINIINVPIDTKQYRIETFIWDNLYNMNSLINSKELK